VPRPLVALPTTLNRAKVDVPSDAIGRDKRACHLIEQVRMGAMRGVIGLVLLAACSSSRSANRVAELVGIWDGSNEGIAGLHSELKIESSGRITWMYGAAFHWGAGAATGTFRNGSLMLSDFAVSRGESWWVRELHHVRVGEREFLMTDSAMERRRRNDGDVGPHSWWGLRRRRPKAVLQRRIAETADHDQRTMLVKEWCWWPPGSEDIAFLESLACDDPCEDVRNAAQYALCRIGVDENGEVSDVAAEAAAKAANDRALEKARARDAVR
jgi:hypothetical protein